MHRQYPTTSPGELSDICTSSGRRGVSAPSDPSSHKTNVCEEGGLDLLEDFIMARFKQMGTNTYRMFNPFNSTMINTAEPANIQALLATKFHDFDLGVNRRKNFFSMFGNGIFTAEGDDWSHFRHQLKPQFARAQVSDLDSASRHLEILFKALPEEDSQNWIQNVDLMPFLYRFTMDVSTEFLFGKSVDTQSRALHSLDSGNSTEAQADLKFATAMEFGQEYLAWRFRLQNLYCQYRAVILTLTQT